MHKNIIVETCLKEIARENKELKQEVARLTRDLTKKKGNAKKAQLHLDNTIKGLKKSYEGEIMVCWVCYKKGNKSYRCKTKIGEKI
jgi:rubrerythrin